MRTVVEAQQGVEHTGAMIALLPSDDCCDHMHVENGESPDQLHLTLFYLGDAVDYDDEKQQEIVNAIESMVKTRELPTVTARTFGVNHWNTDSEEPSIVLAVGDVEEGEDLAVVRGMIDEALADGMVMLEMPEQHTPWVPHVALAYSDDTSLPAQLTDRVGREVVFDHIRVAFGGTQWDIPLGNGVTAAGTFEEHEHPRGKGGKFVKKGAGVAGAVKKFAPTKAIYGKPSDGEVVAENPKRKLRWNAKDKKFDLEDQDGALIAQFNKTQAYDLVKEGDWNAPGAVEESTPSAKPVTPSAAKPSTSQKPSGKFAPTKIAYGKHENGAVVAELVDEDSDFVFGRMVWNEDVKKFATQVAKPDGTWKNIAFITKGAAYEKLKTASWQLPKSGPVVGEKIAVSPSPVQPKAKKVPLTTAQENAIADSIDFVPAGLSVAGSIFDTAFVIAKVHNASIADVLSTYDESKGYKVGSNELGPTGMLVHNFLQTNLGKKFAADYVKDFGVSESILGFKPGEKTSAVYHAPPKPASAPAPMTPIDPVDIEAGVRPRNSRSDSEMRQFQNNTPPPWTNDQMTVLDQYTGTGYIGMNDCLRGLGGCNSLRSKQINIMKNAMRPIAVEVTSYRGVGYEAFGLSMGDFEGMQDLEGKTISDAGFVSTSIDIEKKFDRAITMTIHTPKGAPAAYVDHISQAEGERELILQAGTKFKVLKVSLPRPPKLNKLHVELEVVL